MPTTFRPYAPDQSLLFPASPRDWLPEGHLAFFIADTVAALDLQVLLKHLNRQIRCCFDLQRSTLRTK